MDDLQLSTQVHMQIKAYPPSAPVKTTPANSQAWAKFSDTPVSADIRRIAAQGLAKSFGGDPNSADSRHYGRLAGFTNQKSEYSHEGRQPYVLAHDCSGKTA